MPNLPELNVQIYRSQLIDNGYAAGDLFDHYLCEAGYSSQHVTMVLTSYEEVTDGYIVYADLFNFEPMFDPVSGRQNPHVVAYNSAKTKRTFAHGVAA